MEDLKAEFERVVGVLRERCQVPDIVPETARMLFILESPHVQEIRFGAPVSGLSGASMSRHLFGPEYAKVPLGRLVKGEVKVSGEVEVSGETAGAVLGEALPLLADNVVCTNGIGKIRGLDTTLQIGLMNVIDIPLQASAYPENALCEKFAAWFQAMETVRVSNNQTRYRSEHASAVQAVLQDNLRYKLEGLTGRTLTVVPCGKFAQKFFRLAAVMAPGWKVIPDVPHPSYNAWDKERYQPAIDAVVCEFQATGPSAASAASSATTGPGLRGMGRGR